MWTHLNSWEAIKAKKKKKKSYLILVKARYSILVLERTTTNFFYFAKKSKNNKKWIKYKWWLTFDYGIPSPINIRVMENKRRLSICSSESHEREWLWSPRPIYVNKNNYLLPSICIHHHFHGMWVSKSWRI